MIVVYSYRQPKDCPYPFAEVENGLPVHTGDLRERVRALNLPPHVSTLADSLEAEARLPLSSFGICNPMGKKISPTYGQAPAL